MKLKQYTPWFLIFTAIVPTASAGAGSYGNQNRVNVQNRSVNNNTNVNRNVSNNTNVNRNVNVNQNVNVNRDVNVNVNGGCCYNGVHYDNDWNWGSFAAGAAVGAVTTGVVAAATRPDTVVVAAPAIGTVVNTLPGACGSVMANGVAIYNCNNVYYRPYYQGTTLVYQVVTYP